MGVSENFIFDPWLYFEYVKERTFVDGFPGRVDLTSTLFIQIVDKNI